MAKKQRTPKTRNVYGVECASAREYRLLRSFIANHPSRAGAHFEADGSITVTNERDWTYVLILHSGKEIES